MDEKPWWYPAHADEQTLFQDDEQFTAEQKLYMGAVALIATEMEDTTWADPQHLGHYVDGMTRMAAAIFDRPFDQVASDAAKLAKSDNTK